MEDGHVVRIGKIDHEELEKEWGEYVKLDSIVERKGRQLTKQRQDLELKKEKIQKEIEQETRNAEKEIEKFKFDSINKVGLISEDIVSSLLKDIFGEEGNKSSIKATVSEVIKRQGTTKP